MKKFWRQSAAFLMAAVMLASCGILQAVGVQPPEEGTLPENGVTSADPDRSQTFVSALDFEALEVGTLLGDFKVDQSIGADGTKGVKISAFQTEPGTHSYTLTLPAELQFAPGDGAEYLWFYADTGEATLKKGWITLQDEDGNTFSPDWSAPTDGTFFQQSRDGVWETQRYQHYDNGCFIEWKGEGYVRFRLSDFGIQDLNKKIVSLTFHIKDRIWNSGETPIVYPAETNLLLDQIGFSGDAMNGTSTVGALLHEENLVSMGKVMLADFDSTAQGSTIPGSSWAGYPNPGQGNGTHANPASANGYQNSMALTLYAPASSGTGNQYTVFANSAYIPFAHTDFAERTVSYFELWVDFSQVTFAKLGFRLRSGGLFGREFSTNNKKGDDSMTYLIQENGEWVEKPFGGTDGCLEQFGSYKGWLRIPISNFVSSKGVPIDRSDAMKCIDCFGLSFMLQDASMTETPIVIDEVGMIASPVQYVNEKYYFANVRRLKGSFIQSWLVQGWSQNRWDVEMQNMKRSGMDFIILQSIANMNYEKGAVQNPDKTKLTSRNILYPSRLPEFEGAPHYNALEKCLKSCKKYHMQVMIGSISDNRIWRYGITNKPTCPFGKFNAVKDSYMTRWLNQYDDRNKRILAEIQELYGAEYQNQIYGFYYNLEFSNYTPACLGTDGKVYAQIIGNSLSHYAAACSQYFPGKPMLLSPFVHPENSGAKGCGKMWTDVFSYTDFRNGDIFCPQDSFGNHTNLNLAEFYQEYQRAVNTKPGLKLWANNECFRDVGKAGKDSSIATLNQYIEQIRATAPYTSGTVSFSWNHYYSPMQKNAGYDAAYRYYIETGHEDEEAPAAPTVTVTGQTATVVASDNVAVHSIRIYKSNQKTIVKTNVCTNNNDLEALQTFADLKPGTYYAQALDFFENGSALVQFVVPAA